MYIFKYLGIHICSKFYDGYLSKHLSTKICNPEYFSIFPQFRCKMSVGLKVGSADYDAGPGMYLRFASFLETRLYYHPVYLLFGLLLRLFKKYAYNAIPNSHFAPQMFVRTICGWFTGQN